MNFKKVFRGFYKSNGKKPILSYKNNLDEFHKKLISYEEANKNFNSFIGYLEQGYILVDLDNKLDNGEYDTDKTESKKLIEILKYYGINTPIVETTHGHHFYFKTDKDIPSLSGVYSHIGLKVDYKTGNKIGASCLKFNGELRKIINDTDNISDLPFFLLHNKLLDGTMKELESVASGTGARNSFISKYKYQLLKNGYSEYDTYRVIEIINNFIFREPLPMKELTSLMRQEHIDPSNNIGEVFTSSLSKEKDNFLTISKNGSIKVNTRLLAKKIIKDNCLIAIDDIIYKFVDTHYKAIESKDIELETYRAYSDIKKYDLKEVSDKVFFECKINFDKKENLDYIAVKNGILNLKTYNLEEPNKDKTITKYIPWDYIPCEIDIITGEPVDSEIKSYILDLVDNDKNSLYIICEFLGQALYQKENIIQKSLIIKGDKQNGKSKFLQILNHFFTKDNVSNLDMKKLEDKFGLQLIVGKMVNIGDDISNQYIGDNGNIKKLITSEPLTIEPKGKPLFNYKPRMLFIFSCNDMPRFDDKTGALKRRFEFMGFNKTYSKENGNLDPFIVEKMTTEKNMTELLNLAIFGLQRIKQNHRLTYSENNQKLADEFDEDNNPIKLFIDEYTTNSLIGSKIFNNKPTQTVYNDYVIWCANNGLKEMSKINFSKQLLLYVPFLFTKNIWNNGKAERFYFLENITN